MNLFDEIPIYFQQKLTKIMSECMREWSKYKVSRQLVLNFNFNFLTFLIVLSKETILAIKPQMVYFKFCHFDLSNILKIENLTKTDKKKGCLLNFRDVVNNMVAKFKLNHQGFYCKYTQSFFIRQLEKSEIDTIGQNLYNYSF